VHGWRIPEKGIPIWFGSRCTNFLMIRFWRNCNMNMIKATLEERVAALERRLDALASHAEDNTADIAYVALMTGVDDVIDDGEEDEEDV
jgi:hypothetical protein